jgi:hypothetical protein
MRICIAVPAPARASTFTVAALLHVLSLVPTLLWQFLGIISTRPHAHSHHCACPCTHIPFQALLRSFFTHANPSVVVPVAYHPLSTMLGLAFSHLSTASLGVCLHPILSLVMGLYMQGSPLRTLSSAK